MLYWDLDREIAIEQPVCCQEVKASLSFPTLVLLSYSSKYLQVYHW